jgi:AraC-like DNA-binding protein
LIRRLAAEGVPKTQIADRLGISTPDRLVDLMDGFQTLPKPSPPSLTRGGARVGPSPAGRPTAAPTEAPHRAGPQSETGRLSTPVQRRLTDADIDHVIQQYREGDSIDKLAHHYKIHRTTLMHHLAEAGVARRRAVRKMTGQFVAVAAEQYEAGASLAALAGAFGVRERTLAGEFRRAGVVTRPRRGWRS